MLAATYYELQLNGILLAKSNFFSIKKTHFELKNLVNELHQVLNVIFVCNFLLNFTRCVNFGSQLCFLDLKKTACLHIAARFKIHYCDFTVQY